jgi:predicted ester cyclase
VTLTAGAAADKEASMITTSGTGTQTEAAKAVVRSFVDAWNSRDFGRFGILMAEGASLWIGGGVVPCDPAGTQAIAQEWTTAFPDWRFDLLALIAEGDLVVAHMPYAGTHRGAILGIEPTNRFCSVDEIVIFRLRDGKIAEAWEVYDEAGMWRQLGVAPPG